MCYTGVTSIPKLSANARVVPVFDRGRLVGSVRPCHEYATEALAVYTRGRELIGFVRTMSEATSLLRSEMCVA